MINISWHTYETSDSDKIWRCDDCNNDYRRFLNKNMSEEKREHLRILGKEQWDAKTPEEKQKWSNDGFFYSTRFWNTMTEEEYFLQCEKISKAKKESWNLIPPEIRKYCLEPAHLGFQKWLNSLSEEQYKEYCNSISIGLQKYWATIPEDQRCEYMQLLFEGRDRYFNNLSDEEYEKLCKHLLNISSEYFANETFEQKERRITNLSDALREYRNKLTYDEFIELEHNKAVKLNNNYSDDRKKKLKSTEIDFMNLLDNYDFDYKVRWYNITINQDFRKEFPYNPYLNTEKISPFHEWDFLIIIKPFNILIDVDGSVHKFRSYQEFDDETYKFNNYVQFNDSQRKYQTDRLDAYIIQCYDDKLSLNNLVINVIHGKSMSVKDLFVMLKRQEELYNKYRKEIDK